MRAVAIFLGLTALSVLSGCSAGTSFVGTGATGVTTPSVQGGLHGTVHGGQSPVSGATIQLWQVGSTGVAFNAVSLISGSALTTAGEALTDANGNFDITGQYTCPSGTTLVYITATGGNPGLTAGTNNSALVLMAALGPCGTLASLTGPIVVNEVTTVASIYALAQFTGGGGSGDNVSYYYEEPQTLTGLTTAFSEVLNMIDIYTGTAYTQTVNGTGYVPQAEINTLADILVPCVNSASTVSTPSSACAALFADAPPSGGTAPTTVLGAALDIAQNPGNDVSTLFGLSTANAAFQPTLPAAPNDWTVALAYDVSGATYPKGLALDGSGNVWITAWVGNNTADSEVLVISPIGVPASNSPYSNSGELDGSTGIAIDGSGNAWIGNCVNNFAVALKLQSNTIALAYGPYSVPGMSCPLGAAVDGGNVWFTNFSNNTVTELLSPYSSTNYATYSGGGLNEPNYITFVAYYNSSLQYVNSVWVGNLGSNSLTEFIQTSGGTAGGAASYSYTASGLKYPGAIAVDQVGNFWATGSSANLVGEINFNGSAASPSGGWTGGGLDGPNGIAIDGAGNVWVTNVTNSSITELNGSTGAAITPSTGYQSASLQSPEWIAIDASGNIWAINTDQVTPLHGHETVTEFLGVAAPTGMPLTRSTLPVN
jgi:hypothetical protein